MSSHVFTTYITPFAIHMPGQSLRKGGYEGRGRALGAGFCARCEIFRVFVQFNASSISFADGIQGTETSKYRPGSLDAEMAYSLYGRLHT